jgi:hypothetical protein
MENLSAVAKAVSSVLTEQNEGKTIPLKNKIKTTSIGEFITSWKADFTERIKVASKSKKRKWTYFDAVTSNAFITDPLDKVLIDYLRFIKSDPLKANDYFKYIVSYQDGRELDIRYFKHDKQKLLEYYERVDSKDEEKRLKLDKYNFEAYVLFMMLKLNGVYSQEYDKMFNVTFKDSREYNPLTKIPSVLRSVLPFKVKEFDIVQAFPSFIFKELNMQPFDVYAKMGDNRKKAKTLFNKLINSHKGSKTTIEQVRKQLSIVYGDRVNEVITEERFNNKSQTFIDFTKYEEEYIQKFVNANNLDNYVRLHDGVIVLSDVEIKVVSFDYVSFAEGQFSPPVIQNDIIAFHTEQNETDSSRYAQFFNQEGFIRLMIEGKDDISIIKNKNKVVKKFNWKTETLSYLKKHIVSLERDFMENKLAEDEKKIKNGFLLMDSEPLRLQKDEKDAVYISFKNGVAKVSSNNVELIPYDDEEIQFFSENESQKHELKYDIERGEYSNFYHFLVYAVTGRDNMKDAPLTESEEQKIRAFFSMMGYLISNYKDPSKVYAIVLSDEGANNTDRKGRRGKTLLIEALKRVRSVKWSQGDSFKTDYIHKFANVEQTDDIFMIDDAPAKFNYNSFYGEITGDVKVERKQVVGEVIPFEDAPKFVFTTNYNFRYNEEDASTIGRFYEYKLKPFFSVENKVDEYFKQTFFSEWNADEWNAFYCFMIDCAQQYLKDGLIRLEHDKSADNYNAYFNNEVKETEMERILDELKPLREFTTLKFLEVYKLGSMYSERLFNDKNVKKHIEVFTKHRTDYRIERKSQTSRVWVFVDDLY